MREKKRPKVAIFVIFGLENVSFCTTLNSFNDENNSNENFQTK